MSMKKSSKEKKFKVIFTITGFVLSMGIVIGSTRYYITSSEPVMTAKTETSSEVVVKTQSKPVTIITKEKPTLNQVQKSNNISAAEQSNLEKAIDELIILTESEQ